MQYYIIIYVCTFVQGILLVTDSPQLVVVIMQLYAFIVWFLVSRQTFSCRSMQILCLSADTK